MSLDASSMKDQLDSQRAASDSLTAACQGILKTELPYSDSSWYATLQKDLSQAQDHARAWVDVFSSYWHKRVLDSFVSCRNQYYQNRDFINKFFDKAQMDLAKARVQLLSAFVNLESYTQMSADEVDTYEICLNTWGQDLQNAHQQMAETIARIQAQEDELTSEITAINVIIAELHDQLIHGEQDLTAAHQAAVYARLIDFLPTISWGPSGLTFGPPATVIAADRRVSEIEANIHGHRNKIAEISSKLDSDQAQIATLQGLTLPTRLALNDLEVAKGCLSDIRVSWKAFFQELKDMKRKIEKAETAEMLVVHKAWFNAACEELNMIFVTAP